MKTLKIVWLVLVAFSLFAFVLGYFKFINETFVAILLLTTFIKGFLVIEHFMDLKEVSLKYRVIPSVWLFVVLVTIAWSYYK